MAPATKSQSGRVLTPAELHRGAEDQAAPMESIDSSNPTSPHFKCTAASVSLNLALPFFTFGIPRPCAERFRARDAQPVIDVGRHLALAEEIQMKVG